MRGTELYEVLALDGCVSCWVVASDCRRRLVSRLERRPVRDVVLVCYVAVGAGE